MLRKNQIAVQLNDDELANVDSLQGQLDQYGMFTRSATIRYAVKKTIEAFGIPAYPPEPQISISVGEDG